MSRANSNIKDASFIKSFVGMNKEGRYLYHYASKATKEQLLECPEEGMELAKDAMNAITIGQLVPCDVSPAFVDPKQDLFTPWTSGPLKRLPVGTMYIEGGMIRRADDIYFNGKVSHIKKFTNEHLTPDNLKVKMSNDEGGDMIVSRVSLRLGK